MWAAAIPTVAAAHSNPESGERHNHPLCRADPKERRTSEGDNAQAPAGYLHGPGTPDAPSNAKPAALAINRFTLCSAHA